MHRDLRRNEGDTQTLLNEMIKLRAERDALPQPDLFTVQLPVQSDNIMINLSVTFFNGRNGLFLKEYVKNSGGTFVLPPTFTLWKLQVHPDGPADFKVMDDTVVNIQPGDLFEVRNH